MNVERVGGKVYSLVFVGESCLMWFCTNQSAWEYISLLSKESDAGSPWPEPIYLVLVLADESGARFPQIGEIVRKESRSIEYNEKYGDDYNAIRDKVLNDWPRIKESIDASRIVFD